MFIFKYSHDNHAPESGGAKERLLRTLVAPRFGAHRLRRLGAGGSLLLFLSLLAFVGISPALAQPAKKVGHVTEFPVAQGFPGNTMVRGSDGNLWFGTEFPATFGRITPTGQVTQFPDPTVNATGSGSFTLGPDGNVWFFEVQGFDRSAVERIGRITPAGQISEFLIPPFQGNRVAVNNITVGSDGNLWFTSNTFNGRSQSNGFVGRVTTAGVITEFGTPTPMSDPDAIALGSDGNIWFTEAGAKAIGRITTR